MRSIFSFAAFAALATAAPTEKRYSDFSPDGVYFPLKNGFPDPTPDQLRYMEQHGRGSLPIAKLEKVSDEGIKNLQLIAFIELFEVAYYNELYHNLTQKAPGYDLGYSQEYAMDAIRSIISQEELHALTANGALMKLGKEEIQPCRYQFPVTDFHTAIALASTFTEVGIGALGDMNTFFAENGDTELVRKLSAVIGNEGEQNGFFRLVGSKPPTSAPFPTAATREWAFSAIKRFTIDGSCPNIDQIKLKSYKPLTLLSKDIELKTQNLKFSFKKADATTQDWDKLGVVLINQQNKPIKRTLIDPKEEGDDIVFEAAFPFDEFLMHGLTLAVVTTEQNDFVTLEAVEEHTMLGPALINLD